MRVPDGTEWVWQTFLDLLGRMDWQSIDAYMRVTGRDIGPHELSMLRAMDAEYQKFTREKLRAKKGA